jgi:hypothetical protein
MANLVGLLREMVDNSKVLRAFKEFKDRSALKVSQGSLVLLASRGNKGFKDRLG